MWDLIVSVSDHCLSFYFSCKCCTSSWAKHICVFQVSAWKTLVMVGL